MSKTANPASGSHTSGSTQKPGLSALNESKSLSELSDGLVTPSLARGRTTGVSCFEHGCLRLTCGFGNNPVVGAIIGTFPLFAKLSEVERNKFGAVLQKKTFKKKKTVIDDTKPGEGLYIINKGKAKVCRTDSSTGELSVHTILKKGDFFGEAAQLFNCARGMTVVADGALTVYLLTHQRCDKLFKQNKGSVMNSYFPKRAAIHVESSMTSGSKKKGKGAKLSRKKRDSFMQKHLDTSKLKITSKETFDGENPKIRPLLLQVLADGALFRDLSIEQKENIVNLMKPIKVPQGVTVVREGETGSDFYIITDGEFSMYRSDTPDPDEEKKSTGTLKLTKKLKSGECFGAVALMYSIVRDFTIKATGKNNILYSIDRISFRSVVAKVAKEKYMETIVFLRAVDYLKPLKNDELSKIVEKVTFQDYVKGEVIVPKGQRPDSLYIIVEGKVEMLEYATDGEVDTIVSLDVADFFGEYTLLKDQKNIEKWTRTTIKCVDKVKCLKLDPESFSLISDAVENLLMQRIKRRNSVQPRKSVKIVEKKEVIKKDPPIERSDLRVLGFLGKGSYGHVQLVQHKKTKETYALKGVMKREIVECDQVAHIVSEKRVMMILDSPFILRLHNTYKDDDCVYFLLEAALGGELFNVLRARTIIDEKTARYYVASVCLAFDYMHSKSIVYRDLKPENILLDARGFAKVADFGFAKVLTPENGNRSHTLCGTPDYLAPEVILGTGHSFGFDWWCIGIFIYELIAGWPPFMDDDGDVMNTYENIMNHRIEFPEHISDAAQDIMDAFLQHKPAERLGMSKEGIEEIKIQSWYHDFDWDGLINGTLTPPVKPIVKNNKDLSNFDEPEDGEIDRTDLETYEPTTDDHLWLKEF